MTLDDLRHGASPFPTWALKGKTACCFFSAAFLGINAEIHVADAGMTATCVDVDWAKLREMHAIYPEGWTYLCRDAFLALDDLRGQHFDLVTADPFTDKMAACWERREDFKALGSTVILGISPDVEWEAASAGWTVVPRSKIASWAIWT